MRTNLCSQDLQNKSCGNLSAEQLDEEGREIFRLTDRCDVMLPEVSGHCWETFHADSWPPPRLHPTHLLELTCRPAVRGDPPTEAHLVELPADGPGAHFGPGGGLKLGGESLHRGQAVPQRHFLQHLTVLLFELVRPAAPGQSRRYPSAFPLEDDGTHGGPGQVQQGRNLPDRLLTQVAADHGAPLEVTELLTATHCAAEVRSLQWSLTSSSFPVLLLLLRFLTVYRPLGPSLPPAGQKTPYSCTAAKSTSQVLHLSISIFCYFHFTLFWRQYWTLYSELLFTIT